MNAILLLAGIYFGISPSAFSRGPASSSIDCQYQSIEGEIGFPAMVIPNAKMEQDMGKLTTDGNGVVENFPGAEILSFSCYSQGNPNNWHPEPSTPEHPLICDYHGKLPSKLSETDAIVPKGAMRASHTRCIADLRANQESGEIVCQKTSCSSTFLDDKVQEEYNKKHKSWFASKGDPAWPPKEKCGQQEVRTYTCKNLKVSDYQGDGFVGGYPGKSKKVQPEEL